MNERIESIITIFAAALVVSLSIAGWSPNTALLTVDAVAPDPQLSDGWQRLVHFSHNAYHSWRVDPLFGIQRLLDALFFPLATSLLVFFAGVIAALSVVFRLSPLSSIAYATLLLCAVIELFALDRVVIGSLSWMPWLLLILRVASTKDSIPQSLPLLIIALFLGQRTAVSANHLSLWIALFAFWLTTRSSRPTAITWGCLVALVLPTIWPSLCAPVAPWPDYPGNALLVSGDGLPGNLFPLITPGYPQPVIDRIALKSLFGFSSLALIFLSLPAAFAAQQNPVHRFSATGLLLAMFCVLDTVTPEHISSIMPIAAASRVVPGLFFIPLVPVIFAITFTTLFFQIASARSAPVVLLPIALLLALLPRVSSLPSPGILQSLKRERSLTLFTPESTEQLPSTSVIVSPSHALLRANGGLVAVTENKTRQFIRARRFVKELAASHRNEPRRIKRMLDGKVQTRWSSGKGAMTGVEWIYLIFTEELLLDGIELSPGKFKSDFPAGLTVHAPENCPAVKDMKSPEPSRVLKTLNPWQGPIHVTPLGFPYLGWQGTVQVKFSPTSVRCLLIEQTATRAYDWSVAEIRLSGSLESDPLHAPPKIPTKS